MFHVQCSRTIKRKKELKKRIQKFKEAGYCAHLEKASEINSEKICQTEIWQGCSVQFRKI